MPLLAKIGSGKPSRFGPNAAVRDEILVFGDYRVCDKSCAVGGREELAGQVGAIAARCPKSVVNQ